ETDGVQFLPRISLDQTTGNIAIGFHDTRNDTGADGSPNDDAQYFAAGGVPTSDGTGIEFTPNVRVGVGKSSSRGSENSIEFGDYTGLVFHDGVFYPAFADNSNS